MPYKQSKNHPNAIAQGSLFIITASSGTGKTSLVNELLSTVDNLAVSVSHTTRQPRSVEIDGTNYHFTTVEAFKSGIESGDFLEYAEVFGNYYGTAKSSVQNMLNNGVDVVLEIDWQGALQVQQMYRQGQLAGVVNELNMIFILPPSKEALRERLSGRGQDSDEVIENRLDGAVTEMSQYDNFDYLVINDDFNQALSELTAIIIANRQKRNKQQARHANLIKGLLK